MGLDYVDIFYSHRYDPDTPLEETMGALDYIVKSGRALYVGISSYNSERTREAAAILKDLGTPCVIHQPAYNMLNRWVERDGLKETLQELGIGSIAFTPLAQGLLGGKYGLDNRPGGVRAMNTLFATENLRRVEPLLQTLRDVAADVGAEPAQVALAWLIALPGTVAIPGASSVEQLEFNVAAADIELGEPARHALTAAARTFTPAPTGRVLTDVFKEKLGRR
ncbi:MAG: aldo/keto reductase, partial [Mycobacterium sp.]